VILILLVRTEREGESESERRKEWRWRRKGKDKEWVAPPSKFSSKESHLNGNHLLHVKMVSNWIGTDTGRSDSFIPTTTPPYHRDRFSFFAHWAGDGETTLINARSFSWFGQIEEILLTVPSTYHPLIPTSEGLSFPTAYFMVFG